MRKFKIVCDVLCLLSWIATLVNEILDVIAGEGFNPMVGIATLMIVILHYVCNLLED